MLTKCEWQQPFLFFSATSVSLLGTNCGSTSVRALRMMIMMGRYHKKDKRLGVHMLLRTESYIAFPTSRFDAHTDIQSTLTSATGARYPRWSSDPLLLSPHYKHHHYCMVRLAKCYGTGYQAPWFAPSLSTYPRLYLVTWP